MQLTIYRGTREVGGTMIEMKTGNARILLDAGYPLFFHGRIIDDELVQEAVSGAFGARCYSEGQGAVPLGKAGV